MTLAVIILTYNEEKHIGQAIQSAYKVTREVLIIDSGSTDNTVAIAKSNGAKVFFRPWDNHFGKQRNFAQDKTSANWLLHLDADERLSDELAQSIKKACEGEMNKTFGFKRQNIAFGKKFKYGVFGPDKVIRLFPRNAGHWEGAVHERLVCPYPEIVLHGILAHYTYDSLEHYYKKFENYTNLWAQNALDSGKRTSRMNAWVHAIFAYAKVAFLKKGILEGALGLTTCKLHYQYTLTKYLKLYRLQNHKN